MKQPFFIKFDPRIKRFTGCDRATLILEKIEFFFSKQPNGFYKFIEPCSHRLYKKFDSWSEELGCDRKCFTRSWEKIAFRHKSRRAFNEAKDKFEGQLYASFYDRNRNQMFFIRNHELANETLKEFYKPKKFKIKKEDTQAKKTTESLASEPLRNGHSGRSDKDVKMTPSELFKNNSHAEEIIKKMIEIWIALVEEGRELVKLSKTTIPFLKKAFTDKFDNCLEKWKKYCYDIASSRFLMGEKNSFKAKLDWALMFKNIEKVLDGQYGIGDRSPKAVLASQADLQEEILTSGEIQEIKDFRILCLKTVGNGKYVCWFKNLTIEFREEGEIALIAAHRIGADLLEQNCYSYLRLILQGLGENSKRISILAPGETRGRLIERERGSAIPSLPPISTGESSNSVEFSMEEISLEDEILPEFSLETSMLREKLRSTIPPKQFPSWLGSIEVEGISQDGTIVVTLEDSLTVGWCRSRFSKEIFQSVASLWNGLNRLVIREKVVDRILPSIENLTKISENVEEKSALEKAIQSFLSVCPPRRAEEIFGEQGACKAFG